MNKGNRLVFQATDEQNKRMSAYGIFFYWRNHFFKAWKFKLEKKKENHSNFLNREEKNSFSINYVDLFFQFPRKSRHFYLKSVSNPSLFFI